MIIVRVLKQRGSGKFGAFCLYQPFLVMRSRGEPQSSTVKAVTAYIKR